jgi:hypothetical protein
MATAVESRLLNSLFTRTIGSRSLRSTPIPCTYMSKILNSETPRSPCVVVFSFKVLSNSGMRQISSTSRRRLPDCNVHIAVASFGDKGELG